MLRTLRRQAVVLAIAGLIAAGCSSAAPSGTGATQPAVSAAAGHAPSRSSSPTSTRTTAPTVTPSASAHTGAAPSASATATTAASCAYTKAWGTSTKTAEPMSIAEIYRVHAGRHPPCYDRVVFDINGIGNVGYTVAYAKCTTPGKCTVSLNAKGDNVQVAGNAALAVGLHAPAFPGASGSQPGRTPWKLGQVLVDTPGWPALRQVRFAGGWEGYSGYAVGVQRLVPFRVFTLQQGSTLEVVLDIAYSPATVINHN